MLKGWTIYEKLFFAIGTLVAIVTTIVFKATWVDLGFTLLYFWTAILLAKGKYACYIIGIISTFFYAYDSFINVYYGEVIISMCCTLPLMIIGLVNWVKHQDKENTVVIKDVTKKELLVLLASQTLLFAGYYYLLQAFNTKNLWISTISVVVSVIASYLTARRSEHGFIGFIINDIVLIGLWGLPIIQGNLSIMTVALCLVLLLINDIYGVYNWRRIKLEQRVKMKE